MVIIGTHSSEFPKPTFESGACYSKLTMCRPVNNRITTGTPDAWGGLVSQWQQAQLVDRWNSPSSSFYAFDSQGSTRVLTNPAGAVTDAYAYRYAGEYGYYRDSAAVQYVRARYLNIVQGRWLRADQIMTSAGKQLNGIWQVVDVLLTRTLVAEALVLVDQLWSMSRPRVVLSCLAAVLTRPQYRRRLALALTDCRLVWNLLLLNFERTPVSTLTTTI